MKYAVDRIENDIAVLENLETKEKKEVSIDLLPSNVHEQAILTFQNNTFSIDLNEEEQRKASLRERLERLKKL